MTYITDNIRIVHAVPHYFWSRIPWSELNKDEMEAWKIIDRSNDNLLKIVNFDDYDNNQQKAIQDLGFKDYTWNAKPINPKFPTILFDEEDDEDISVDNIIEYWDVHNWIDLNTYNKELFSIIGFDKKSFDYNIYPNTNWEDFNEEEIDALCFLGYNQSSWNEILDEQLEVYKEDNNYSYEIEIFIELDDETDTEDDDETDNFHHIEKTELEEKYDFMKNLRKFNKLKIKEIINSYITFKKTNVLNKKIDFCKFINLICEKNL